MDQAYKRYLSTMGTIWTVCFGLVVLLYAFLLLPQEKALKEVEGQLVGKQIELNLAEGTASEVVIDKTIAQIEAMLSSLESFTVTTETAKDMVFNVAEEISALGVRNVSTQGTKEIARVLMRGFKPNLPNSEFLLSVPFTVDFSCDFLRFARVINHIERREPILFVDDFSITSSLKDNNHEVKLTMKMYIRKPLEGEEAMVELIRERDQGEPLSSAGDSRPVEGAL